MGGGGEHGVVAASFLIVLNSARVGKYCICSSVLFFAG